MSREGSTRAWLVLITQEVAWSALTGDQDKAKRQLLDGWGHQSVILADLGTSDVPGPA